MLQKILRSGISDKLPKYLNNKIYLSNILSLIIAFGIALPFGVISLVYFQGIAYIPLVTIFICLGMIAVNRAGFYNFSRLVTGLWPFFLTAIFGAYLTPAGASSLAGVIALQLAFGIVPFIVFDIREKWLLIFCGGAITISAVFGTHALNAYFEKDFDITVIETGYIYNICILTALMASCGGALFMSYLNHISNVKTEKLVDEMDARNEELMKSENTMKENIRQIEENQIEEQKRNWASEGLAKFGNLLRSNQESKVLFDQLISGITQYLKSNQGALFLVNSSGDETKIDLQSCYAYERKKFVENSILPGEGLIGQAYHEKDVIYLKDIPSDYLKITSGLGESLPRAILIIPLMVNEEVEGFFEIASFNHFESHEIEFLKALGENVASFISINRINEKTKYLLEETQQQAEEMKSQEEEMRQNMEELQATQEEMQRKEKEYLDRINQLERSQNLS